MPKEIKFFNYHMSCIILCCVYVLFYWLVIYSMTYFRQQNGVTTPHCKRTVTK